jgi:Family of unknown function (DUF6352)
MQDFWRTSGFNLLTRNAQNYLQVTDDFLRHYLQRPELAPIMESCDNERALHQSLLDQPQRDDIAEKINTIVDKDAQDNYRAWLNFRDRMISAGSIEACYLQLMREGNRDVAPLFIDHMAQLVARNMLDGETDPLTVRAAELFYRAQSVNTENSAVMAADAKTVDMYATTGGFGTLGKLLRESNTATRAVSLDVLNNDNAVLYWMRDERHDTVIDLTIGRPGITMLCGVLEKWLQHLLGVRVSIKPVEKIHDANWAWHVGLDAESNALLNDLYQGKSAEDADMKRIVGLFRLTFLDVNAVNEKLSGKPVYLGLAVDAKNILRLKPQNLLLNLPLKNFT